MARVRRASSRKTRPSDTLRARAAKLGRWIGTAVNYDALRNDPQYGPTVATEFDTIAPENAMKWDQIQPKRDVWTFGPADEIVAFAGEHGLRIRGHTFVYHKQLPGYINDDLGPHELRMAVDQHIRGVVTRYRGQVSAWDVVNEAVDETGTLRDTVFLRILGDSYIADAFACARDADPTALLFYNDFGAEDLGAKSDAVCDLVSDLRRAGVPIDGVGLQMHVGVNAYPPVDAIAANVDRLASCGLRVAITEMDVSMSAVNEELARQREIYHDIVRTCVRCHGCHAISFWGFTDKYTWLPGHAPLLLDEEYQRKPAYAGVQDALATP